MRQAHSELRQAKKKLMKIMGFKTGSQFRKWEKKQRRSQNK